MQFVFSVPSDGRRAPQGATLCGGHREHNFWAMHSSGFFASMVNSFSLVLQNLWMLSQCSLYSATLLCQACLSFMWPRSMPSNRAIFPSLPFGIFPCVSSNRRRRWTSHITNWMKSHVSIESLNLFFSICFERSIFWIKPFRFVNWDRRVLSECVGIRKFHELILSRFASRAEPRARTIIIIYK